jgi:PAS domain S-box-containing protein
MADGAKSRLAGLVPAGTSGSWDWDIKADQLRVDHAFADLYGLDEEQVGVPLPTATFFLRIHRDDCLRMKIAVAGMLYGAPVFAKEFRVHAYDGSVRWMQAKGKSHLDPSDQPIRFTGILVDITERRHAEERMRIVQESGGIGTFEYSEGYATATVSRQFCRLLGLHPTSTLPVRTINGLVRRGSGSLIPHIIDSAGTQLMGEFEVARSSDGEHRWIARRGEVVRDDGASPRLVGVIYDVTANQVLVHELQHRTRNLLGVVRATAAKTLKASSDLADFATRFESRIDALGRVQGLLSRLGEHDRVTFDELIQTELAATSASEDRVTLDGPANVRLRSSTLQLLAMAIHELATNALKYGALRQPGARLSIRWRMERAPESGAPWLYVDWSESGVALNPRTVPRHGQGRELIERALPYQLNAKTRFELRSDGVRCTIAMPVSITNERAATG